MFDIIKHRFQTSNLALNWNNENLNSVAESTWFSLPFVSIFFGIVVFVKTKDRFVFGFFVIEILFCLYGFVGFPEILAKLTLLSNVPTSRLSFIHGYLLLLILFRSLALMNGLTYTKTTKLMLFSVTSLNLLLVIIGNLKLNAIKYSVLFGIIMSLIVLIVYGLCSHGWRTSKYTAFYFSVVLLVFSCISLPGVCVNPIIKGLDVITENQEAYELEYIARETNICVASEIHPITRIAPYCGIRSLAIQVYPLYEQWVKIDPLKRYESVWNRYAHISINLKSDGYPDFKLMQSDLFHIDLTLEDLKKLGITHYVASNYDQFELSILEERAKKVGETHECSYYRI